MTKPSKGTRRPFALLSLCLFAFTFTLTTRGQPPPRAYKIDETDYTRCDLSEVPQVTDAPSPVFVELDRHPGARAAVVVRGPLAGDAINYARRVKHWLTGARGVTSERVFEVYGGWFERKRLEIWLVPEGAAPPPASPPVAGERVTMFDEYDYWEDEVCGLDRTASMKTFADTLKSLPGWRGTVVLRPHANRRGVSIGQEGWTVPLPRRQAARHAAQDRLYFVRQLGLDPARIRVVVGASDSWGHAELWLVPPSAQTQGFHFDFR